MDPKQVSPEELLRACAISPVFLQRPSPWCCVGLRDYHVFETVSEFIASRDDLRTLPEKPTVILVDGLPFEHAGLGFPYQELIFDPFVDPAFRRNFVQHVPFLMTDPKILKQSHIASLVEETTAREMPPTVVLIIVDGLSYRDWNGPGKVEPCLVDGLTNTQAGTRRIVGKPPLARRLLSMGYHRRIGFSYWTRDDNDLTDSLFHGFTRDMIHRIRSMNELTNTIHGHVGEGTYVQVVRQGLDGLAHQCRDRPNVKGISGQIADDVDGLVRALRNGGNHGIAFVTSDHGILWFDEIMPDARFLKEPATVPLRYYESAHVPGAVDQGQSFFFDSSNSRLLAETIFRRSYKSNEWGAHGGISVAESVTPFVTLRF